MEKYNTTHDFANAIRTEKQKKELDDRLFSQPWYRTISPVDNYEESYIEHNITNDILIEIKKNKQRLAHLTDFKDTTFTFDLDHTTYSAAHYQAMDQEIKFFLKSTKVLDEWGEEQELDIDDINTWKYFVSHEMNHKIWAETDAKKRKAWFERIIGLDTPTNYIEGFRNNYMNRKINLQDHLFNALKNPDANVKRELIPFIYELKKARDLFANEFFAATSGIINGTLPHTGRFHDNPENVAKIKKAYYDIFEPDRGASGMTIHQLQLMKIKEVQATLAAAGFDPNQRRDDGNGQWSKEGGTSPTDNSDDDSDDPLKQVKVKDMSQTQLSQLADNILSKKLTKGYWKSKFDKLGVINGEHANENNIFNDYEIRGNGNILAPQYRPIMFAAYFDLAFEALTPKRDPWLPRVKSKNSALIDNKLNRFMDKLWKESSTVYRGTTTTELDSLVKENVLGKGGGSYSFVSVTTNIVRSSKIAHRALEIPWTEKKSGEQRYAVVIKLKKNDALEKLAVHQGYSYVGSKDGVWGRAQTFGWINEEEHRLPTGIIDTETLDMEFDIFDVPKDQQESLTIKYSSMGKVNFIDSHSKYGWE